MIIILIVAIAIFIFIFFGFNTNMQSTTLYVGKKIAPLGSDYFMRTGLQDAITPRLQDKLNTLIPISYICILILGTFLHWYLGFILMIVVLILSTYIKLAFAPKKMSFYLKYIIHDLNNREANYIKSGDKLRAEASKEISGKALKFLNSLDPDFLVPNIHESMKMKNGWISL